MAGAPRYELISKLGEGGMGVVYEALDRERNMRVALKTLRRMDAASLYQFKREFRALSDLSHPNIVALYELVAEGDDWFLSMELVEGDDLITYVRTPHARGEQPSTPQVVSTPGDITSDGISGLIDVTIDTRVVRPANQRGGTEPPGALRFMNSLPDTPMPLEDMVDLDRLMDALSQLAQALYALHSQGMVHRDLKPANVCVTREGRVVLMDFGIVAETVGEGAARGSDPPLGTPAYMAPEQATDAPPTAAADWYAFGVLLYQALTGRLPFRGPGDQLLEAKRRYDPVPPDAFTAGIPGDLQDLCMGLLARDPATRPHGYDVLTRLGVAAESISRLDSEVTFVGPGEFVGRSALLQELDAAYREALRGKSIVVIAAGASGMGKTTLLRRFIYELQATQIGGAAPLVLSGRCHERESLSYKAFDGVIDQLSRELLELPEHIARALLPADPEDMDLLNRLFPVLRRIPGVTVARPRRGQDLRELRARAMEQVRALFRAIAAWRPVVLRIEDLQWTDGDSIELLHELFRPPAPTRLLLLASLRTDVSAPDAQPSLDQLARVLTSLTDQVVYRRLDVGPLSRNEQELLIARLMGERNLSADIGDTFWAEAEGNPLLLAELARYAAEAPEALSPAARPQLGDVIARRIARLSDSARALLEIVAVAGEPTPQWLLAEAVDLSDDDRERASATLRVAKLARVAVPGHTPWLNTQHDKIRETVLAHLPVDRRRLLHRRLAHALERWDSATVPSLAHHWLAAGDRDQAASYLQASARAAADKLAFDRAAELYHAAAELLASAPADRRLAVLVPLGEALALAGRYHEAANAYVAAASLTSGDEAMELERLGANNLLRCGRIDEALARLTRIMKRLGVPVGQSRRRNLVDLVVQRTRLALRGVRYEPRRESEVPARELGRLDTMYAAASALGMVDHLLGAVVQARHLRMALQIGEERRVCRALATEVAFLGAMGGKHARRATEMADEVHRRARALGDERLVGLVLFGAGFTAYFGNRMSAAESSFSRALDSLEGVAGVEWERMTARFFLCLTLVNLGAWGRAVQMLGQVIERAERNRDIYAINLFKAEPNTWRWLISDSPGEAHRSIDAAMAGWPPRPYYLAHYQAALSRALVRLYEGNGEVAAEVLDEAMAHMSDLMLDDILLLSSEVLSYRGRAALLMKDAAMAQRCARRLTRLELATGPALAALIEAPLRVQDGDSVAAETLVASAMDCFATHQASHMVAACRYKLGQLVGGGEGDALKAEALAWMKDQNVANPLRMIALLTWGTAR